MSTRSRHHAVHTLFAIFASIAVMATLASCKSTNAQSSATASAHKLTEADIALILDQAEAAAAAQPSLLRRNAAGETQTTRMHIIVINRGGGGRIVGRRSMPDAWHGSLSIATAKAYTAMSFSSDHNALTTRSIGALSQPGGPLWHIGNSNHGLFQPGLIEFPGGLPLYKNGTLVGGIGVSGDGVDEDEAVAIAAAKGFEPPEAIRIDTATNAAVPYVK